MVKTIGTRLRRLVILGGAMVLAVAFADVAQAGDLLGTPAAPAVPAAAQPVAQTTTPVTQSVAQPTTPVTPAPSAPAPAAPVSTPVSTPAPAPAAPTPATVTTAVTNATTSTTSTATNSASDLAARVTSTASSAANDVTSAARPLVQAAAQTVESTAAPIVRSTAAPIVRLANDSTSTVTRVPDTIRTATTDDAHGSSSPVSSPNVTDASKAEAIVAATSGRTAVHRAAPEHTTLPRDFRFTPRTDVFAGSAPTASTLGSQSREHSPPRLPERSPPPPRPDSGLLTGLGGAGAGGLLLFGLLVLAFLLATPNAVRWLRPALALGLSPAYVAPGDRPG